MNRKDMLSISLNSWIKFNQISEIIIVDWSSEDNLSWVLDVDRRIKFIRVEGEKFFNIAQAYNLAIRHTAYEYVLKLDVDYILNPYHDFFQINIQTENSFLAGNWRTGVAENKIFSSLNGLVYINKKYFYGIGGYNENYNGYGEEDEELYKRLEESGLVRLDIKYDYSVIHMPHSNFFRTNNYENKSLTLGRKRHDDYAGQKRSIVEWKTDQKSDRHIIAQKIISTP